MSAAASRSCPAAHDHVQSLRGLQLHPALAASARIKTVDALANNSFQGLFSRQFKQFFAAFQLMVGKSKGSAGIQDATKEVFSLEQRNVPQVVSIAIKQIKEIIGHRVTRQQVGRGPLYIHALLHELEIASALLIQDHDFAI